MHPMRYTWCAMHQEHAFCRLRCLVPLARSAKDKAAAPACSMCPALPCALSACFHSHLMAQHSLLTTWHQSAHLVCNLNASSPCMHTLPCMHGVQTHPHPQPRDLPSVNFMHAEAVIRQDRE